MQSLRSLMTGLPDIPPFRMLLAPGWEQFAVTDESAAVLARRASERIRHLGRPDLDGKLGSDLHRSFTMMQKAGSRIVYLPSSAIEGSLVPMSLVASVLKGENGQSLDGYVARSFREAGAEFFDAQKSIVRWTRETRGTDDMSESLNFVINYVIAVPDSGRRRAVLLTSTILQGVHDPLEPELLRDCVALSDAMISTFAWLSPEFAATAGDGVGTSPH